MAHRKHPWVRRMLGIGVVAGATYAVWRAIEKNRPAQDVGWEPQPFPFPPQPRVDDTQSAASRAKRGELASERAPAAEVPSAAASERDKQGATETSGWVEADDGACPLSHPVKAKLASGIYHLPGGFSYDRTRADRCYTDATAAETDGLRAAKR